MGYYISPLPLRTFTPLLASLFVRWQGSKKADVTLLIDLIVPFLILVSK